jgi:hypothetical protein
MKGLKIGYPVYYLNSLNIIAIYEEIFPAVNH